MRLEGVIATARQVKRRPARKRVAILVSNVRNDLAESRAHRRPLRFRRRWVSMPERVGRKAPEVTEKHPVPAWERAVGRLSQVNQCDFNGLAGVDFGKSREERLIVEKEKRVSWNVDAVADLIGKFFVIEVTGDVDFQSFPVDQEDKKAHSLQIFTCWSER